MNTRCIAPALLVKSEVKVGTRRAGRQLHDMAEIILGTLFMMFGVHLVLLYIVIVKLYVSLVWILLIATHDA